MKLIAIDFEYRRTNEAKYDLVSCAYCVEGEEPQSVWLYHDTKAQDKLKQFIFAHKKDIFLAFNVDAEGRSFYSLDILPYGVHWIDLMQEWKMLTNHCHAYMYGKQLIQGKEVTTYPLPPFDSEKSKYKNYSKPDASLVACTYKLLGQKEDLAYKDDIRQRILKTEHFTEELKQEILDYGLSDIKDLFVLYRKFRDIFYQKLSAKDFRNYKRDALWRGESVARAAVIAAKGYPVNVERVKTLAKNAPELLKFVQEDVNRQFPDIQIFEWNKRNNRYTKKRRKIEKWLTDKGYAERWKKTKTGLCLEADEWDKHFPTKYDYKEGFLPHQIIRFEKTNKAVKAFMPKAKTAKIQTTFFSYLGSEGRAHPYLNAYGAQSARYQPKATGFLHLQPAWLRALVEPTPGKVIASIDYGSEEFLISGLVSKDQKMIDAYRSGDVYLYFAKLAGAVPWDGKKSDYKDQRNKFKSTTLGLSYGMGPKSLAYKLTADTGEKHTEKDAREMIELFEKAYPVFTDWVQNLLACYGSGGGNYYGLHDGWVMWGDNSNERSVRNMPIQGAGSCILRKAIQLCQDAGIEAILPLHDALYIEFDYGNWDVLDTFYDCMKEAFVHYFKDKESASLIRLDGDIWGPEIEGDIVSPMGREFGGSKIYIDSRARKEYELFSPYMDDIIKTDEKK